MQDVLPETGIDTSRGRVDVKKFAFDGVLALEELRGDFEVELVAAEHIDGLVGEQASEILGLENAENTAAFFVRVDDVEAEETGGVLFKGTVGVPGEFTQRVRDRNGFLARALGVDAFGLVFDVPESALGAAVGVGFAAHLVDNVKYESAVWVGPAHLYTAYAVFPKGIRVHPRHGLAYLTVGGFEDAAERELEFRGFGRCAFFGDEGVVMGHLAEVIKLLEGRVFAGGGGSLSCCHGKRAGLLLRSMDAGFRPSGSFDRWQSSMGICGIESTLFESRDRYSCTLKGASSSCRHSDCADDLLIAFAVLFQGLIELASRIHQKRGYLYLQFPLVSCTSIEETTDASG